MNPPPELLLSLPPNMCRQLADCQPKLAERVFTTHDPPEAQLGSGGGTAYVLSEACRAAPGKQPLEEWLASGQRIVLHGGGESRRLPAYAAVGKLFIPVPVLRWSRGQRLGQSLLDLNEPFLRRVFAGASDRSRVMIASGDVLIRATQPLPELPDADVVLLGMWASPEAAENYGVMFYDRAEPSRLVTFLQKPPADETRDRSRDMPFLIDVGVWLLSERAARCLMRSCGWDEARQAYPAGATPENYDLYGTWSKHLGDRPVEPDDEVSRLTAALAPIRGGEFYHFGTTSDVIESIYTLQNLVVDPASLGAVPSLAQPKQFIQDSTFGAPLRKQSNDALWVEGSCVPESWRLSRRHMFTGVPDNTWRLDLREGACLDFTPVGAGELAVRVYGFADRFRGPIGDDSTRWMERPARDWFAVRGVDWDAADLSPDTDLQLAPIFPVIEPAGLDEGFVQWLLADSMAGFSDEQQTTHRSRWLQSRRLSAREIGQLAELRPAYAARRKRRQEALPVMIGHGRRSIFSKIDLADVAAAFAESGDPLPPPMEPAGDFMLAVHDRMFRSEVLALRGANGGNGGDAAGAAAEQQAAFSMLADAITQPHRDRALLPRNQLLADQIVWARSPARIDFAGGWTDTPPYCLEQGGSVVNIALNLNGQPPIQAFARRTEAPTVTLRSIDLGQSVELSSYEELAGYRRIGDGFSIAKAAVCLCGFHPDFNGRAFHTLGDQLNDFGGGLDLSMLAAIPKGSGLGTSSILAGTVLAALSECSGLGWDAVAVAERVSVVEQMLGTGGGWQDQLGGLLPGAKLIQTKPGAEQTPAVRWLPTDFFQTSDYGSRALLYYTGITRVAHDVLGKIVRGMFLNDPERLSLLAEIGANSQRCFDAVQRFDAEGFSASVAASWELNRRLDAGANPEPIQQLVERIEPHAAALKLCGAGGGGFLYLLARDAEHARRLRSELEADSPNDRARFVDMSVSTTGLQVTRS